MRVVQKSSVLALAMFIVIPLTQAGVAEEDEVILVSNHIVTGADNIPIAITVFQPESATAVSPVPVILHSHGWGGSRATSVGGSVAAMLEAGYGVVSFDARGHGDSGGVATVHHADHEVKDLIILLDWIHDNLDWVQKESDSGIAKDIVAGAIGGSYGGGYQLQLATYDGRLDALAPQMTWNDLRYSLAPNGVVKSVWVDALYGAGKAQARIHPDIDRWWFQATTTNDLPPDALQHFAGSSPHPDQITAPTLLVQGIPDLLFNLNEAIANYQALQAAGTETALVTYLGGHVLPGVQPVGVVGPARGGEPCGAYSDLARAWFDKHLRGDASAVVPSGATFALENGECVQVDDLSDLGTRTRTLGDVVLPSSGGSVLVRIPFAEGVLAGIPRLTGTYTGAGDHIFFLSLVVVDDQGRSRIVDDQSTPVRLDGTLEVNYLPVDLAGVATRVDARDELFLRIDGVNEWYATAGGRTPATGVLSDVTLELPYAGGGAVGVCTFPPSPSSDLDCFL